MTPKALFEKHEPPAGGWQLLQRKLWEEAGLRRPRMGWPRITAVFVAAMAAVALIAFPLRPDVDDGAVTLSELLARQEGALFVKLGVRKSPSQKITIVLISE